MNTLENEQEKSRFTTFEEIKDIKILSTEEISKLSEADRDTLVQDAVQNLDEYTRSKYIENRKKIIISSLASYCFIYSNCSHNSNSDLQNSSHIIITLKKRGHIHKPAFLFNY